MKRLLLALGLGVAVLAFPPTARADFSWEVEITVRYSEAPLFGFWDRVWVYECFVWDQPNNRWVSLGKSNAMWAAGDSYRWKTSLPVGKANGKYFVQIVKTKGGGERSEYTWDRITWKVIQDQEVPYRVPGGWSGTVHYVKLEATL